VYLAGLRIPDEDVRELITLVDEPTRSRPYLARVFGNVYWSPTPGRSLVAENILFMAMARWGCV